MHAILFYVNFFSPFRTRNAISRTTYKEIILYFSENSEKIFFADIYSELEKNPKFFNPKTLKFFNPKNFLQKIKLKISQLFDLKCL